MNNDNKSNNLENNSNTILNNKIMTSRSEPIIGVEGLENIRNSKIVIVGTGGLGSFIGLLLARMQPKELIIIDYDKVEESNLERQALYSFNDIGKNKITCAKKVLSEFCNVTAIEEKVTTKNIKDIIPIDVDLVMDCVDNTCARKAINKYCRENKINWIHAAIMQQTGILAFFNNTDESEENTTGCFECYNQNKQGQKGSETGVLNSSVATISSMSANIAINFLATGEYPKDLIRINLKDFSVMKLKYKKCFFCR